jgi:hypothetical protein
LRNGSCFCKGTKDSIGFFLFFLINHDAFLTQ